MLLRTPPDLAARHEQHALRPGERLPQGARVVVVGAPHDHTALGEVGQGLDAAPGGDQIAGGHAAAQQVLDGRG